MADAQPRSRPGISVVGSCTAADCRHNEDHACHAGEIVVRINAGSAVCGTYSPGSPQPRP